MAGGFDRNDCIAEYLNVKTENGAFAVIMNARYGWFWAYSTDGDSSRLSRQFWDAVYGEKIPTISIANQDSKEDNLFLINRSCMRWTYYQLNLFGDPTIAFHISKSPKKPIILSGSSIGKPGEEYFYKFVVNDPDEDNIYLRISWGDNNNTGWIGLYNSGEEEILSHIWSESGKFALKAKVKDIYGAEGEWAEFTVSMPRDISTNNILLLRILERFPLLQQLYNVWRLFII